MKTSVPRQRIKKLVKNETFRFIITLYGLIVVISIVLGKVSK